MIFQRKGSPTRSLWIGRPAFLVLALWLAHLTLNMLWTGSEPNLDGCDVLNHLNSQLRFFDILTDPDLPVRMRLVQAFDDPSVGPLQWPRLTYLVSSPGTALLGRSAAVTVLWTGSIVLCLLLFSTYWLGRSLVSDRVGMLAAAILSLCPMVFGMSRKYGLDLPLTALVTASTVALVSGQGLRSRRRAVLLGLLLGITLLTKLQGLVFLGVPVAFVILDARRKPTKRVLDGFRGVTLSQVMGRLLVAVAVASALVVAVLRGALVEIARQFVLHSALAGLSPQSALKSSGLVPAALFYPANLVWALSPLIAVLVVTGGFLIRPGWLRRLSLFAILVPMLFFAVVFEQKWARYIAPVLPFCAVMAAAGLERIRARITTIGVLAAGMVQLIVLSFALDYERLALRVSNPELTSATVWAPLRTESSYERQLRPVAGVLQEFDRPLRIGIVEDPGFWGSDGLSLIEHCLRRWWDGERLQVIGSHMHVHDFFEEFRDLSGVIVLTPPGQPITVAQRFHNVEALQTTWSHLDLSPGVTGIGDVADWIANRNPQLEILIQPELERVTVFPTPPT